jgi:hypothetical protein
VFKPKVKLNEVTQTSETQNCLQNSISFSLKQTITIVIALILKYPQMCETCKIQTLQILRIMLPEARVEQAVFGSEHVLHPKSHLRQEGFKTNGMFPTGLSLAVGIVYEAKILQLTHLTFRSPIFT